MKQLVNKLNRNIRLVGLEAVKDADGRWAALAIEFKTTKGKQSPLQKAWQTELEKPGCYRYEVVRSFEQFRDLINNYLG